MSRQLLVLGSLLYVLASPARGQLLIEPTSIHAWLERVEQEQGLLDLDDRLSAFLGWFTRDATELGREIGHGGFGIGVNSELAYYPDHGLTIIVLGNRARVRFEGGVVVEASLPAREVRDQLLKNLAAGDFSALPEPTRVRNRRWILPVALGLLGLSAIAVVVARRRRP